MITSSRNGKSQDVCQMLKSLLIKYIGTRGVSAGRLVPTIFQNGLPSSNLLQLIITRFSHIFPWWQVLVSWFCCCIWNAEHSKLEDKTLFFVVLCPLERVLKGSYMNNLNWVVSWSQILFAESHRCTWNGEVFIIKDTREILLATQEEFIGSVQSSTARKVLPWCRKNAQRRTESRGF